MVAPVRVRARARAAFLFDDKKRSGDRGLKPLHLPAGVGVAEVMRPGAPEDPTEVLKS